MKKIFKAGIFLVAFFMVGVGVAKAVTVTCYDTCDPVFSNYIGEVILDLQCNSGSPLNYTGSLTVNNVSLSYDKPCVPATPAPTLSFSADPTSILRGESSMLTWTTTNAASCTASGGWSGSRSASGGTFSVSPTENTTYRLRCWNSAGVGTPVRNVTITVTAAVTGACGTRNTTYASTDTAWPGSSTLCETGTASPASVTFPAVGSTANWQCQGSGGGTTASCGATRTSPITVLITSVPSAIANVGQPIRWTATVSGGVPPYTFPSNAWTGVAEGAGTNSTPTTNYIDGMYGEVGTFTEYVRVTDSTGLPATDDHILTIEENRDPQ